MDHFEENFDSDMGHWEFLKIEMVTWAHLKIDMGTSIKGPHKGAISPLAQYSTRIVSGIRFVTSFIIILC